MSAGYVREKFRTWAADVSVFVGIQYYDTVNKHVRPSDEVWWTAEFGSEFMEGTFCAKGYIETGFIRVIAVSKPGTGDFAAVDALERIVPQMFSKIDPTQRLVIETYEPIEEESQGTSQKDYRMSVLMDYRHSL